MTYVQDPPASESGLIEFANMAYMFMTGIPGFGTRGFCMMDPETLKKQRITYVEYWRNQLEQDLRAVAAAASRK